jgi:tetratricopeptide (TPR) repeat protein
VELHLALKTLLPDDPSTEGFLLHQLREFFTIQRSVYAQYEQIKNEDKSRVKDDRISTARTLAFLCEQEINHTELDVPLRTNDDTRYHLSRLLRTFIDEDDLPVTKMTVVSDRGTSIYVDPMQILAFDFASTLIPDSTDEDTDFLCNNVTILIDYDKSEHPFGMDSGIHRIVVNLQAERKGEKSLYFRVAVHMPAPAAVPNGISNRDFMRDWNFLMAYDLVSPAKKLAEYNYVLSEQQSKMKKGENLSDEEFALYVSDDDDSGYNQYWGERAFIVQRYYEAIYFLEHLYVIMQKDFYTFDKDMKNTFYHTCYMLGYSYMELKLYKQAFFYLEPLTFLSRIDYSMEYINCLVNSKNFNALQFITKMLEGVSEDINNPDPDSEPSEPLKALYNFLRRRRAYVYVDLGRYDEAEKEFIQMLDEPLNKDFALGELAYIQRLRKEADTK